MKDTWEPEILLNDRGVYVTPEFQLMKEVEPRTLLMHIARSPQCAVTSEEAVSVQERSRYTCARLKGRSRYTCARLKGR
ncbi:unnamed protein product [Staurois parvus]|uniref:Uncharacterized protein n=1 Tax=Staurois parvus TaxID=386267 RepID=A0ABN9H8L4_9NEOB|nr:unnamed protein product [Staurois parvus]